MAEARQVSRQKVQRFSAWHFKGRAARRRQKRGRSHAKKCSALARGTLRDKPQASAELMQDRYTRGHSSLVEYQLPKLRRRVRFPLSAPALTRVDGCSRLFFALISQRLSHPRSMLILQYLCLLLPIYIDPDAIRLCLRLMACPVETRLSDR